MESISEEEHHGLRAFHAQSCTHPVESGRTTLQKQQIDTCLTHSKVQKVRWCGWAVFSAANYLTKPLPASTHTACVIRSQERNSVQNDLVSA